MHNRIAIDAVTGSSPRMRAAGMIAATGSAEKRMMRNPMTAFQKPAAIQGNVTANSASSATSIRPKPPGARAVAASTRLPAMVSGQQDSKQHPPAEKIVPGGDGLYSLRWGPFQH